MRKFISGLIGAFAALTILGSACVYAVEGAVGEVLEGAENAAEGALEGAENIGEGILGINEETPKDGEIVPTEDDLTPVEEKETKTDVLGAEDNNPDTGIVETAAFGAIALSALTLAATAKKKR
ncbi:MAG: hypothetical protein FWD34_05700 [Oscillospiraceae bacterium]|nr:hypothetical protein [Oscillospiraceae bacterium]